MIDLKKEKVRIQILREREIITRYLLKQKCRAIQYAIEFETKPLKMIILFRFFNHFPHSTILRIKDPDL